MKSPSLAVLAATIATAGGLAVGAGPALAAGCTGAPGASAIQQYCEAVPNADGSRRSADTGTSKPNVSSSTAQSLKSQGSDGAAVEALTADGSTRTAASTSPKKRKTVAAAGTSGSGGTGGGSGAVSAVKVDGPKDPSGSPLSAATHAVASGPTVGTGLVWGLVGVSALGIVGALFMRRRSGGIDPTDET